MSNNTTPAICGQAICGQTICGQAIIGDELNFDSSKSTAEYGDNPKINLVTGRLLYVHQDISIGANTYGIKVSHIYNSAMGNSIQNKFSGIGRGWKLNVHQCIIKVDNDNYKFFDEIGYVHAFVKFDSVRYHDTEGLGFVLTINPNASDIIEDEAGNIMKFDSNGRLYESVSCENAAITKKYIYNSANQLIMIYDIRHGISNPTRYIQLKYDSNTKMLDSVSVYDSAVSNYIISELKYEYLDDKLINVIKNAYDINGTVTSSKEAIRMLRKDCVRFKKVL